MLAAQMETDNLLIVRCPLIIFLRYSEDGCGMSFTAISQVYEDLRLSKNMRLYCWKEAVKNILK
jgi:hypothetical protein